MVVRQRVVRSFALIDTLVTRRWVNPRVIFDTIESQTNITDFARRRSESEHNECPEEYTLQDIYANIKDVLRLDDLTVSNLMQAELSLEFDNFIPVREHCEEVRTEDLVISDMYFPESFLRKVLTEICDLPFNPLFISPRGKRNGSVWIALKHNFLITEHLGDDRETDLASPRRHDIPARLTTVTRRTARESFLADHGLEPLSNVAREARLSAWEQTGDRRRVQLSQIQGNFPIIFLASLHLVQMAEQNGWSKLLFSSRDCYLWSRLYPMIAETIGLPANAEYFYTSRAAKANASPSYLRYFNFVRGSGRSVIVDACGTGWSNQRLIDSTPNCDVDIFMIHKIISSDAQQQYAKLGKTSNTGRVYSLSLNGDNIVLEMMNRALHPMVDDVASVFGSYVPVFSDIAYDADTAKLVMQHHTAFMQAKCIAARITKREYNRMLSVLDPTTIVELYRQLVKYRSELTLLFEHQSEEEAEMWRLLAQRSNNL